MASPGPARNRWFGRLVLQLPQVAHIIVIVQFCVFHQVISIEKQRALIKRARRAKLLSAATGGIVWVDHLVASGFDESPERIVPISLLLDPPSDCERRCCGAQHRQHE